jgi:hypothetical protein
MSCGERWDSKTLNTISGGAECSEHDFGQCGVGVLYVFIINPKMGHQIPWFNSLPI